ncbi:MAG: hypothetical protein H7A21_18980 [Spirochaetales bacterium]|nr:hypothetical protein [Spirochaetales bacterium]
MADKKTKDTEPQNTGIFPEFYCNNFTINWSPFEFDATRSPLYRLTDMPGAVLNPNSE